MKRSVLAAALGLALFVGGASAQEFERNIMTGGAQGTYIKVGRDIAGLGAECGLKLNVVESAGSLENFVGVRNRRNTQFGIVQSDVLEYLKTFEANDPEVQKAVKGVRIMFPLYNEEIHVLARKDIGSMKDLTGRKVAVGKKDSGTFLTATLIMDILQVKAGQRMDINPEEALPKLLSGEIDAFFYVAGAPASLFSGNAIDKAKFPPRADHRSAAAGDLYAVAHRGRHLCLSGPAGRSDRGQGRDDDLRLRHQAQCLSPRQLQDGGGFLQPHRHRLDKLKTTGHPKWKTVDLTALPPGWQVGVCVKAGMALDYKPACKAGAATSASGGDDSNEEYLNLLKQRLQP
jgi:hypothetical protein